MLQTKVFVISLKGSNRINLIQNRLKDLKIKYEIFYGINGKDKKNYSKLIKNYNSLKTEKYIGRKLAFPEIAASLSHINIYKLILRKKIRSAIIIEDDAYPSETFAKWIKRNVKISNNIILSFYCYPSGFLNIRGSKTFINGVSIHEAITHVNNSSCYQINLKTCKKILKLTKGKVCGVADWPFNFKKDKISLFSTIPYLTIMDDHFESSTALEREKTLKINFFISFLQDNVSFNFIKNLLNLFLISYLFKKRMNFYFYKEQFFEKSKVYFKDLFTKKFLNTYKIYKNKNYYAVDLRVHRFFKKKSKN
jgi:GR25 family glycosyltransferase involved in LPS biosynthesis